MAVASVTGDNDTKWTYSPRDAERRRERFGCREALWKVSSLDRVRSCGRYRRRDSPGVEVRQAESGAAYFSGTQTCASVHACPVCAAKIRNGRTDEIKTAAQAHVAGGGTLWFVTLTMPHTKGMPLAALLDTVSDAWRYCWQGERAKTFRDAAGVEGYVRALDATVGSNGWHPHLHCVLFASASTEAAEIRAYFERWWSGRVERAGRGRPSKAHGVDVQPCRDGDAAAVYVAKAAFELARPDFKHGRGASRNSWGVLADLAAWGDIDDLDLWREWEKATKGRRAITWSRGLKRRYDVAEVEDEQYADQEPEGPVVHCFGPDLWRKVCERRGGQAGVLVAVEAGGRHALDLHLALWYGWSVPDPPGG